jgi:1-acyl-sn-glycerol-3-phosphate acyltransferase
MPAAKSKAQVTEQLIFFVGWQIMLWLISKLVFLIGGWRIEGKAPDLPKVIYIAAPHTSGWDFVYGIAARKLFGLRRTYYLGKAELFRPPFGWLFRALGGFPVDRRRHGGLVEAAVALYQAHEHFAIALAPEGTRQYVPTFKTGFYHIAIQAKVPIVRAAFDYPNRRVVLAAPYYPSGDLENDLPEIRDWFKQFKGKYPEQGVL